MHLLWHSFILSFQFSGSLHSPSLPCHFSASFSERCNQWESKLMECFYSVHPPLLLEREGLKREREMIHFPHMLKGTAKDHYPQFEHANRHTHCLFQQTWILVNTFELKALWNHSDTPHFDLHPPCSMIMWTTTSTLEFDELPLFMKLLHNHHCFIKQWL